MYLSGQLNNLIYFLKMNTLQCSYESDGVSKLKLYLS